MGMHMPVLFMCAYVCVSKSVSGLTSPSFFRVICTHTLRRGENKKKKKRGKSVRDQPRAERSRRERCKESRGRSTSEEERREKKSKKEFVSL